MPSSRRSQITGFDRPRQYVTLSKEIAVLLDLKRNVSAFEYASSLSHYILRMPRPETAEDNWPRAELRQLSCDRLEDLGLGNCPEARPTVSYLPHLYHERQIIRSLNLRVTITPNTHGPLSAPITGILRAFRRDHGMLYLSLEGHGECCVTIERWHQGAVQYMVVGGQ